MRKMILVTADFGDGSQVTTTTATTTGRQRGDGSRPSGKAITDTVTSPMLSATGQTPSQAAH